MNLMKYPRTASSISHFARPNSWELEGNTYALVLDDGYDTVLTFRDRKVSYAAEGQPPSDAYDYFCFKADDSTFLVSFEVRQEENHLYVLDLAQRLVTRLICQKGLHPKSPHIMDRRYTFGAIRMRGYKLPYRRHSFTTEHLGTAVQWRWSPELCTKHAYLESDWYRITWDEAGEASEEFDSTAELLPSNDERARYVKIKDRLFLFSVTEETVERFLGDRQLFRCNNLTLLQNYDRMYQVGRGFGDMIVDGQQKHINIPLCAYGAPPAVPEEFLNAKNPFTV